MHSQIREKQQPFFKPLTNTDALKGHSIFETSSQTRQKFQNGAFLNRVRESDATQKNTHQKEFIGNGEQQLSSSYAKMYQEVDKYRKWTVQTEIEIKQKEKKIQDAMHTNESLRKSILELQLQNESLSLRLQEEMNNREEIVQRINATRELCNLLKDHSASAEGKLKKCETERTELKYLEKEHLKQFEDLSEKFRQLEISSKTDHNELMNQISVEREEWLSSEKAFTSELESLKTKLEDLLNQCDEKDIEIRDMRSEVRKNEEKMHDMQCMTENLQTQLEGIQGEFDKKQSLLNDAGEELLRLKDRCCQLEKNILELTANLEETVSSKNILQTEYDSFKSFHTEAIQELNENNGSLCENLEKEKQRITELESELEKTQNNFEELKSARDILVMEKSEVETEIIEYKEIKEKLESEKEENWKKTTTLEAELSQLKVELANEMEKNLDIQTSTENLKSSIQLLKDEKERIQECNTELSHNIDSKNEKLKDIEKLLTDNSDINCQQLNQIRCLQKDLEHKKDDNEHLQSELATKKNMVQGLEKQLKDHQVQIQQSQKQIKDISKRESKLQSKLDESLLIEEELRSKLETLQTELEDKRKENEELQTEQEEQKRSISGELESKTKKTDELENKIKSFKDGIATKTKQVKELEKEVKSLKSKLTSQTKSYDGKKKELENLLEKIQSVQEENESLHKKVEELHGDVEQEQNSTKDAKKEAKEMRADYDQMAIDKENTVKQCEHRMNEMMATLEKYQQENSKIVFQKEKEIESLKMNLDQVQQSFKLEREQFLSEHQTEIDKKKGEFEVLEKEKHKMEESLKEIQASVEEYKQMLHKKEQEIIVLQKNVKSKKSTPVTYACVQTSPTTSPKRLPIVREQIKSTTPKTPTIGRLSNESKSNIKTTPKILPSTLGTPKIATPKTPVTNKNQETVSNSFKTPQRSILKGSSGTSAVKKRRVVFANGDSDGDFDSESSSSELMEIEMNDIEKRYRGGKQDIPLHVRPSPKCRIYDLNVDDTDDNDCVNKENKTDSKNRLQLNRKPRGPPVAKKQENSTTPKTQNNQNIRKTPSRPGGKFFKTSPKDRPQKSKLSKLNEKNESWFDLDSVFGFED